MKKQYAILAVVALCSYITFATPVDNSTSVNVVGYYSLTFQRGEKVMTSMPFLGIGNRRLKSGDVFGDQLPVGSTVHAFDPVTKAYASDERSSMGWSGNIVYRQNLGFWVMIPDNAPKQTYAFTYCGQVLTSGTVTNMIYPNLNMVSYPFPCNVAWTNTTLATQAAIGDQLYNWNGSNYVIFTKTASGWGGATNLSVPIGTGFMYRSSRSEPISCAEHCPYKFP